MKKLIILLISLFFIASCAVVKSSRIVGKCYLGYPYRQIMVFICMLSFMPIVRLYRSAGCYDIIGHWYISGDTVILSSPNFNVETRPIDLYIFAEEEITDWRFPDEYYKFTDMEGNRDAYIIKGDTLYPVLKNGKSLIEYLYAIPKPGPELGLYNRGIYFGPKKDK